MKILISGGTLVCLDQKSRVLSGDLLIDGDRIEALGPSIGRAHETNGFVRVVDARGCAVVPGFVQAHLHLCQTLFRGMADDLPLLEWLKKRIWPLEAAHDEASLQASAELGLYEIMRAGTTSILDMGTVHGHDAVMTACEKSGIRAMSGKTMMDSGADVPRGLRETTRDSLKRSDELCTRWHGAAAGRLHYAYCPRFILSCSEALYRGVAERSEKRGACIHSHVAEHAGEREAVRAALGADDVAMLDRWGVLGKKTVLAHGVQLTDSEAKLLAKRRTSIVHCPSANLKLGSGIARIADLDALGVQLALGADGAACNNNLDPWMELRHAALLAKVRSGTTSLVAERALRLATTDGARALGLEKSIGSLEAGKKADFMIVRIDGAHTAPGGDVFSKLVYACTARDVKDVFVDGAQVVADGAHRTLDEDSVLARARTQAAKLLSRAKL